MKSKLLKLTLAALLVFNIKMQSQVIPPATLGTAVFFDGFENWAGTPTQPTAWMQAPTTTIPASGVTQAATTSTATPAEQGTYACNLQNTATTYSYMATSPTFSVTAGMGYQITYYARGKGTISSGIATGTVNTAPGGEPVSGKTWHQYKQTVIAPATASNAAFFLKIKSTGAYTSGGVTITGVDVDSFCVRPYTPVANVNLYSLQYTTASSGNSPFYGQFVNQTGGIVTAITVGSTGVSGYYVQTTGAKTWAAMSVYDYTNAALVHVGDSITFGGSIDEFYGMTQMSNITNFINVSTVNGHSYTLNSLPLTTQTISQEMYEAMFVNLQGATVNSYTASYGQATITDGSGVPALADLKDGFYAPNGNATSGSAGTPGYVPTAGISYCFVGNVYYSFGYNIEPRDSGDVYKNCTLLGIENHSNALHANVYPNPVTNQLIIDLPFVSSKTNVSITDILGKEIMSLNNLSGNQVSINDMNMPAGVYLVKITADGNTQVSKIVKQ